MKSNNTANVREIRPGASTEPEVPVKDPLQEAVHSVLHATGNIATLGNKNNLKPHKVRQIGALILATGMFAGLGATPVISNIKAHISYPYSSDIPGTEANFNKRTEKQVRIPSTGAFDLAQRVDPGHDANYGVGQFNKQLGHDAQPGNIVVIPRPH